MATTRSYVSEARVTDDGLIVRCYSIISTDIVVLNVWEPIDWSSHSTSFRDEEHGMLGAVRSRKLPTDIDAMPYGDARTARCLAHFAETDALTERAIVGLPRALAGSLRLAHGEGLCDLADFHARVQA